MFVIAKGENVFSIKQMQYQKLSNLERNLAKLKDSIKFSKNVYIIYDMTDAMIRFDAKMRNIIIDFLLESENIRHVAFILSSDLVVNSSINILSKRITNTETSINESYEIAMRRINYSRMQFIENS
ncbi:MAG: hypothetical protein OEZ01_03740 [Candidatus Heimdallarchaeota archaeon]|nr:hypothetical protein [Candidatus Heimdallarchaeota archaeon]MDH5645091.1 hypothetical protein [Candidatus Heimdallarchaeota archaeon]